MVFAAAHITRALQAWLGHRNTMLECSRNRISLTTRAKFSCAYGTPHSSRQAGDLQI
jgi:hypothetical protein